MESLLTLDWDKVGYMAVRSKQSRKRGSGNRRPLPPAYEPGSRSQEPPESGAVESIGAFRQEERGRFWAEGSPWDLRVQHSPPILEGFRDKVWSYQKMRVSKPPMPGGTAQLCLASTPRSGIKDNSVI